MDHIARAIRVLHGRNDFFEQVFPMAFGTAKHRIQDPAFRRGRVPLDRFVDAFQCCRVVAQIQCGERINKITQFAKLRWLNQLRRNRILKCAETVTTISPWHVATLSRFNPNTQLIYNGFDAEKFAFKPVKTDKFVVTYTGRLLDINLRDPRLFLEAVSQLCQDETFAQSICIRWFVDARSAEEIAQLTCGYGLDACTEISKTVSADLMPDILNSSSLVLVLSNKATKNGPHGIMTTKFFEAVGCEKPVLCVRSDDDCLAATIGRTNAGLAGSNVTDVKEFITEKYNEWKSVGYTHQPVNQDEKIKFTRQSQALQFAAIIDKAIRQ